MHKSSKGWYMNELKKIGITKHPVDKKHLAHYRTPALARLFEVELEKYNKRQESATK